MQVVVDKSEWEAAVRDVRRLMISRTHTAEIKGITKGIMDAYTDLLWESLEMREFRKQFN